MVVTHQLQPNPPARVEASAVNYIKLGSGGRCARECFEGGYIGLGFDDIPHELCARGDWEGVRRCFLEAGKRPEKASDHTRELRTFYEASAETLWITCAEGRLWWAFAETAVAWNPAWAPNLPRRRTTIGGWRTCDITGAPLLTRTLSTRLTSVTRYQSTICRVRERVYLLNRLNACEEPIVVEAQQMRTQLHDLAQRLIATLHPRDFEIMVDLIFNASGWRRVSVLGESEADVDLLLEQAATGERAFVQVKSRASPAVLADYVRRFEDRDDCSRMFFVCHSPTSALEAEAKASAGVGIWLGQELAEKALRAGLFDWLVDRVR